MERAAAIALPARDFFAFEWTGNYPIRNWKAGSIATVVFVLAIVFVFPDPGAAQYEELVHAVHGAVSRCRWAAVGSVRSGALRARPCRTRRLFLRSVSSC